MVLLEPLSINKEVLNTPSSKLTNMGHEFVTYDTVEKDTEILKERAKGADIIMIGNNPLNGEVICKLLGYSRSKSDVAEKLGIEYVSLEELLSKSDVVSLHVPLNNETKNLINKERIALMKNNAILINVARGQVVDNEALAEALNNNIIAGAGIDVFEVESPIPLEHSLFNAKNALLTPHVAFATSESMEKRANIVFDNVYSWLEGKEKNIII